MTDPYTTVAHWPWPGDSKLGQIQRIALSYRALCESLIHGIVINPAHALADEDQQWANYGHHWIRPTIATPPADNDWITARDAAHHINQWYPCTTRDIYKWAERGHIRQRFEPDGTTTYQWRSILDYDQARTRRRAN